MTQIPPKMRIADTRYWNQRSGMLYYKYLNSIVQEIGGSAQSIIDVGTGELPYLEWFDWIPKKIALDIFPPYNSETVEGIQGDIHEIDFPQKFDLCTCMQVLEHISDATRFAHRLMEIANVVLVSVPYKWAEGSTKSHVHDPVDLDKVTSWFGRKPNFHLVVHEPFKYRKATVLMALYDTNDPSRSFKEIKVQAGWPLWVRRAH